MNYLVFESPKPRSFWNRFLIFRIGVNIGLLLMLFFQFILNNLKIDYIFIHIIFIVYLSNFSEAFFYHRYYITKIEINDGTVYIDYYRLSKLLHIEYPLNEISFRVVSQRFLWVYLNDKLIIKQHVIWDLLLEKEIWTREKMKEVEAKVKEIKQELNIPQKKYY